MAAVKTPSVAAHAPRPLPIVHGRVIMMVLLAGFHAGGNLLGALQLVIG
jgi:hypothetical protein